MKFDLPKSLEILERTPIALNSLLNGVSDDWIYNNEGENTWSPYDVIGHLIHGERTDWLVRIKIILNESKDKNFEPFDRFAQLKEDQSVPMPDLLQTFANLRQTNLKELKALNLTKVEFDKTGIHPEFGAVTIKHLIATWTVHDLGHIAQVSRTMAKQYKDEVGPWINYLGILK